MIHPLLSFQFSQRLLYRTGAYGSHTSHGSHTETGDATDVYLQTGKPDWAGWKPCQWGRQIGWKVHRRWQDTRDRNDASRWDCQGLTDPTQNWPKHNFRPAGREALLVAKSIAQKTELTKLCVCHVWTYYSDAGYAIKNKSWKWVKDLLKVSTTWTRSLLTLSPGETGTRKGSWCRL